MSGLLANLRSRFSVARFAREAMAAHGHPPLIADGEDAGTSGIRTVEVGVDPIRVLLVGGCAAVSWGVHSREDAIDRPLAREIAAATGRGVVVENRAVEHLRMADAVESLGGAGTHTFHVVIWFPSLMEAIERLSARSWRHQLELMLEQLRTESDVPLVLTCLPVPIGMWFAAVAGRPWALAVNRAIRQAAREHPGVVSAESEPFVSRPVGLPSTDAAYYRRSAMHLVPAVLQQLGLEDRRVAMAGSGTAAAG